MSTRKLNIHIYPTTFKFESRILKETNSIIKLGLAEDIIILAIGERGRPKVESIDNVISVKRFSLAFSLLPETKFVLALKYLEFYFRVFSWMCFRNDISIINCHSLMVLPLGVAMKSVRKQIRLIYDAHELETERNGLHGLAKTISKRLERALIKRCDSVIVVGKRIQEWYENEYSLRNIFLVRNSPRKAVNPNIKSNLLRIHFKIPKDKLLFIYQGMLIPGRGLKILTDVFRSLGPDYHLVVMGYGDLEPVIKKLSKENNNIHFHEAVPPQDIMKYTASCDVGISLIENTSLSYYYSLPNKVFEYLHAGLPVIVSAFPEMESVINEYHVGWAVNPTENDLITLIRGISKAKVSQTKMQIGHAKDMLNWENEEGQLVKAFGEDQFR